MMFIMLIMPSHIKGIFNTPNERSAEVPVQTTFRQKTANQSRGHLHTPFLRTGTCMWTFLTGFLTQILVYPPNPPPFPTCDFEDIRATIQGVSYLLKVNTFILIN